VKEALSSFRSIDLALENLDVAFGYVENARKFLQILLHKNENFLHKSNVYYVRIIQAMISRLHPEIDVEELLHLHLEV